MSNTDNKYNRTILAKLVITGKIRLITGMHVGSSKDFSAIGAVDSTVIRDPMTRKPVIPGSSLKGKMRTLLAKADIFTKNQENDKDPSVVTGKLINDHNEDSPEICRLFGASEYSEVNDPEKTKRIIPSRLQFCDMFMDKESEEKLQEKTDLYLTEIKFENTINRMTCVANPRQIERVPAGSQFDLFMVYNMENVDNFEDEVKTDFQNICRALKMLQLDYLGGHGTRGYGKVMFKDLKIDQEKSFFNTSDGEPDKNQKDILDNINNILEGAEKFALLSV